MNRLEVIKAVENKLKIKEGKLKEEARFKEDLEMDSIDLVEILMDIEEEYDITIPDDKAMEIKTIGNFIDVILQEMNK